MAIEFDCPACDATIRVKDDAAGKKGRCPKCKVLLLVPDPGPEEDEATDEPAEKLPDDGEDELEVVDPPPAVTASTAVESPVTADASPSSLARAETHIASDNTDRPPFSLIAEPSTRGSKPRITRGRRRRTAPLTALVACAGFAVVAGAGWLLYQATQPRLPDQITGELYRSINLPPATLAPSTDAVASDERERVMQSLAKDGLPLKSEFITVWLNADEGEVLVSITPGPQSNAVRVPLGELPSLRAMLSRHRDRIRSVKQRELRSSTSEFFHDYAAYLKSGTTITRLPEYRDDVALNAAVGVTGYAIEAVVGSTPFPCVYEDTTGGCYFFPPTGTQKFRIRGRKLADGTTPLPVDLEVVVKEAESPMPDAAEAPKIEPEQADESDDRADAAESTDSE